MDEDTGTTCKIDRVIERRALDGLDEEFRRRREDDDASLRALESFFNRRVLEQALREHRVETLQGEVANTYRLLTGDDVSAGARTEAVERLERNGVDTAALLEEFVSYQTVRTHLRDCLGVDTSREATTEPSDARDTVFGLLSRAETVTDQTLSRLRSTGALHTGDLDVAVNARVACRDCGREYTVSELLERGHCECHVPDAADPADR